MKLKYAIVALFCLISSQVQAQSRVNNLKKVERFCCYEWLPEFRDSFFIVVDEKKINQRKRYSVLIKEGRRDYGLYCWIGDPGLETPTEWSDKLRIKFKKNDVILFKFGKEEHGYHITKFREGEYLLIKEKEGE